MKYLKYTLLLIILLTFVSVRAETCTYEEKQKLAEKVDLSKLKLTYVKEDKSINLKDFVKAEIKLDDDYSVAIYNGGYDKWITHGYFGVTQGGVAEIKLVNEECLNDIIFSSELLLPYYNPKNKNIFDDGSQNIKINNKTPLIICVIFLFVVNVLLIRRFIKNETM